MKVSVKDSRPGHIGSMIHDPDREPIRLHLTKQDRENIAKMEDSCHSILFFPDTWTPDQARFYLGETMENRIGLPASRIHDIIRAIDSGSLESARVMLLEGIPENTSLPVEYKRVMDAPFYPPASGQEA